MPSYEDTPRAPGWARDWSTLHDSLPSNRDRDPGCSSVRTERREEKEMANSPRPWLVNQITLTNPGSILAGLREAEPKRHCTILMLVELGVGKGIGHSSQKSLSVNLLFYQLWSHSDTHGVPALRSRQGGLQRCAP